MDNETKNTNGQEILNEGVERQEPNSQLEVNELADSPEQAEQSEASANAATTAAAALSLSSPVYSDPKSYLEAPFEYQFSEREQVSLASGSLEYSETDFILPGKNGFDLAIGRIYSSGEAGVYEMASESYGSGQLRTVRQNNTHNLLQYGLGLGWRFSLPSIETVAEKNRTPNTTYSDFLHLEDGRTLEIEQNGSFGFKDYPLQDVTIEQSTGTLAHPGREGTSAAYDIVVSHKGGQKDYFKKVMDNQQLDHYTLTAQRDRLGNCIFYTLHPYGGMEIVDSFGRDVVLQRFGERLTWLLPADGDNNPATLYYETAEGGMQLVRCADRIGRVTEYTYHNPDTYSAVCKYVSAQYGDTTDVSFPWMLLSGIIHPTGARTEFSYGNGKTAQPLKLLIGEYGGYKQSFPLMRRMDISEGESYRALEYEYTLSDSGEYIQFAETKELGGVSQRYTFSSNESKNQLLNYERRHNGELVSSTAYVYGSNSAAANYRQCITQTEKVYGDGGVSAEKVISYGYSSDKKLNIISEAVSYTGETALNTATTYTYGNCSILTEKKVKLSGNRFVAERYELDTSRGSLVPACKKIVEILNGAETLREKTEYLYGEAESPLKYCVVEERRYEGNKYVSTLYGYGASYIDKPTSVTQTGIADANGNPLPDIVEQTGYDIFGNTTFVIDGCGSDTLFKLDALGRVVSEQSPVVDNVRAEKLALYDDEKNIVTTRDENGYFTRIEYSGLGLPLRAYLAQGDRPQQGDALAVEYVYDSQLRLAKEIRYNGEGESGENILGTTLYRYDAFDRVIAKENPEARYYETHRYNEVCSLPFNSNRKGSLHQTTIAGEEGAPDIVTASYLNRLGVEEAQYLAGELSVKYTCDLAGNMLSQTDALGNTTAFGVDYAGRTISITKPFGSGTATSAVTYNALGQRVSATNSLGHTAQFVYDSAGRLLKSTVPFDGRNAETRNKYDSANRLILKETRISDIEWRAVTYTYDRRGRLTDTYNYTASDWNSWAQTHTEYDEAGNKLSVSSCETGFGQTPAWQTQSYTYGRFGNVLSFTDYAGETETSSYDLVGRLVGKTLRDGTQITYRYDSLNRLVREQAEMPQSADETPVIRETEYTRTNQKKREKLYEKRTARFFSSLEFEKLVMNPLTSSYVYDEKGRLVEQTDPDGERKEFEYDLNGNRTRFALYRKDSIDSDIELCYTYTNDNKLASVSSGGSVIASYTYDSLGRKLSQTNANGTSAAYTYNAAGRVTRLENKRGQSIISAWDYEYRLDGIQTSKTDKDGLKTTYSYDLAGRLSQEQTADSQGDTTSTIAYTYDQYGNRTGVEAAGFPVYSETYTYDNANRLIARAKTQNGETKTTLNTYDTNGNLIRTVTDQTEITTRSYNGFGQQVSFITEAKEVWFRYRPDGLRLSKQVLSGSGSGRVNSVTTHHWDGQSIIAESSANGALKSSYLRGNGQLIAQQIGSERSYYLYNAHGDVTERTDSSGNILTRYNYDSFGNILNPATVGDPGEPIYVDQSPFGYCGEYLDRETQEIYLRARYYDSTSGRFTAEDPKRGGNQYAYCDSDPVNRIDPSGKSWLSDAWNKTKTWVKENTSTITKIVTGVVLAAATVAVIAATGGIAAGALIAKFATGVIISTVGGMVTGAGVGAVKHRITTGSWDGAWNAAVDGAADFGLNAFVSANAYGLGGSVANALVSKAPSVLSSSNVLAQSAAGSATQAVDKSIPTPTNRNGLRRAMPPKPRDGVHAHHMLPWKYRAQFAEVGLNVNDPKYGLWVDAGPHLKTAFKYNKLWESFFNDQGLNTTAEKVLDKLAEIMADPGWRSTFGI